MVCAAPGSRLKWLICKGNIVRIEVKVKMSQMSLYNAKGVRVLCMESARGSVLSYGESGALKHQLRQFF